MRHALALALLPIFAGTALAEDKDSYAAIAYSKRTGEYWFSYGMESKEKAEAELTKRAEDKGSLTIVVVKNCYVSLAQSKDGKAYGVGQGDTPREAEEMALAACRKQSRLKCTVALTLHSAQGVGGDSYSCIAFSPSTGRYAVAVAKPSQSQAELEAVEKCQARDAKVVATAKNTCCALALGKDRSAYGVGVARTEKEAQEMALEECRKKTTECRIVSTLAGKK